MQSHIISCTSDCERVSNMHIRAQSQNERAQENTIERLSLFTRSQKKQSAMGNTQLKNDTNDEMRTEFLIFLCFSTTLGASCTPAMVYNCVFFSGLQENEKTWAIGSLIVGRNLKRTPQSHSNCHIQIDLNKCCYFYFVSVCFLLRFWCFLSTISFCSTTQTGTKRARVTKKQIAKYVVRIPQVPLVNNCISKFQRFRSNANASE